MTLFLLFTEKWKEYLIALLFIYNVWMFTFWNKNDGVRKQNKKQKQILFNVFHMWELLFFWENYKLV